MKTKILTRSGFVIILCFSLFSIYKSIARFASLKEEEVECDERPSQDAYTPEERLLFNRYLARRESDAIALRSGVVSESGIYANGLVNGVWRSKKARTDSYGYRLDNSVYDSINDRFYVVTYAGHLYKLDATVSAKWTLLNHKIVLNPTQIDTANSMFFGFSLPDSTYRLIRSFDEMSRVEYSDDEGISWQTTNGVKICRSWANNGFALMADSIHRVVMICDDKDSITPYVSYNNGTSFVPTSISFKTSIFDVRLVNPYNSNDAFIFAWNKLSNRVLTYQFNKTLNDFEFLNTSEKVVVGKTLSNVDATYYEGQYHFYISTHQSTYAVYYCNDLGKNWRLKNDKLDNRFTCVHPTKPNTIFYGFQDLNFSTDSGVSWTDFEHKLGWDIQHMKMHQKSNGKYFAFLGMDFGCYISETPDDNESYKWLNDGASYCRHYDAATSENFNSVYMANQDRGVTAFLDSGTDVNILDKGFSDVLRLTFANNEKAVWLWYYYGRLQHQFNFPDGNEDQSYKEIMIDKTTVEGSYADLGYWWAPSIIASPNASEDAIYAAYGSNLQKFEYLETSKEVIKTAHHFDFKDAYGSELGGFGYSTLNCQLWFTSLNDGTFLYSRNAGDTWQETSYKGLLPIANDRDRNFEKTQAVIKTSNIDTMTVFYAGVNNVFLISKDGGKTFTNHVDGLDIYRIRDFDLSIDEQFIFAACGYGGAWVYSVAQDKWFAMDDSAVPYVDFVDVQFIKKKNLVRFATFGSGIIDFVLETPSIILNAPKGLKVDVKKDVQIDLLWEDVLDNESGFIIERAEKGGFMPIDTVYSNVTTYSDTTVLPNTKYYYQVKAYTSSNSSVASNVVFGTTPAKGLVSNTAWRIIYLDSEELNGAYSPGIYAFDNTPSTFWQTEWENAQPNCPHELQVDMRSVTTVAGFQYLPRQDAPISGGVARYAFYVSNDSLNWGNPVATGRFISAKSEKEVLLDVPVEGCYFRFVALSEVNGGSYTCVAEIAIIYNPKPLNAPSELLATLNTYNSIKLSWRDNSLREKGFVIEQFKGGNFVVIDSVRSGIRSYAVIGLNAATEYRFRVRAYGVVGLSEPSEAATIITNIDPNAVSENEVVIRLYPNPVVSELNLEFPSNTIHKIQIVNSKGEVVNHQNVASASKGEIINLSKLPKGIYFVSLLGDGSPIVKKIIKE